MTAPTEAALSPAPGEPHVVPCDESYDSTPFEVKENRTSDTNWVKHGQIVVLRTNPYAPMGQDSGVSYGEKLKALRTNRKIHAARAAAEMGMRVQTLRQLESGQRLPYEQNRLKIAEYYGVDPDTLEPPGASVIQQTNALPSGAEAPPQTLSQEGGRMPFTSFEIGLHATIRVVAEKWHEPGLRAIKRFVDHIEEFGPQKSRLRSGGVRDE
jgi:transcriptional regulator with XRE-family HTH domain